MGVTKKTKRVELILYQDKNNIRLSLGQFKISKIQNGNFQRYLATFPYQANSIDIVIPDYVPISQIKLLVAGFSLYLKCAFSKFPTVTLSEEEIFYFAVVAFIYRDIYPLKLLDKHLNKLSDTFFWLYLAYQEEF